MSCITIVMALNILEFPDLFFVKLMDSYDIHAAYWYLSGLTRLIELMRVLLLSIAEGLFL